MGGGGGGQTQTSRTEISPEFKPYITYALGEAQRLYQGMPAAPATLAVAPSEATQQALQMAQQRAIGGSPLLRAAQAEQLNKDLERERKKKQEVITRQIEVVKEKIVVQKEVIDAKCEVAPEAVNILNEAARNPLGVKK